MNASTQETTECAGLRLTHDRPDPTVTATDAVLGVTRTTWAVINSTPPRAIGSALELGCGSGALALLAARRARSVVATDVNIRACEYTQLNANANGLANVETRAGSLYEPVDGERFDLIVGNLPFVVSPDTHNLFSDGTMRGDAMSRLAITHAPEHLNVGGIAVMTASWAVHGDATWRSSIASWIEAAGCDAWVIGGVDQSTDEYAKGWNAHLLDRDPAGFAEARDRWRAYYADEGITRVCYGVVVLHRSASNPPWIRYDVQQHAPRSNGGMQVDRAIRNGPRAASASQDALEAGVFAAVAPHTMRQQLDYGPDGYAAREAEIALVESCGVTGTIQPLSAQILLRLDGTTALGTIVDEAVAATGIDRDVLAAAATDDVRGLVGAGIVEMSL